MSAQVGCHGQPPKKGKDTLSRVKCLFFGDDIHTAF